MNKFACYHKPTKCWVFFKQDKSKNPMICLCLKIDATEFEVKQDAENMLKKSSFNSYSNYGAENFLEFTIKKI